jgi:hypothetical protein
MSLLNQAKGCVAGEILNHSAAGFRSYFRDDISRLSATQNFSMINLIKTGPVKLNIVQGGSDISGTLSKLPCRIKNYFFEKFFGPNPSQLCAEA